MKLYEKRKKNMEEMLNAENLKLTNVKNYIIDIIESKINWEKNMNKKDMSILLDNHGYLEDPVLKWKEKNHARANLRERGAERRC
jgi:hypothetical protein